MTPNTPRPRPGLQPTLAELTARFLATKAGADSPRDGEVEPHEVTGGFRASARQTWDDAVAVFRLFGVEAETVPCPPEWASFAGLDGRHVAVPLAAGLFPQQVQDIPALLGSEDLSALRPASPAGPVPGFSALRGWVRQAVRSRSATTLLIASGVAAGLGDWTDAEAALTAAEPLCPGPWRAIWENQRAAILWLKGRLDEATAWSSAGPVAGFNRSVAGLFEGGRADFAAVELPDSSGWSHLAKLYHSVSRCRG